MKNNRFTSLLITLFASIWPILAHAVVTYTYEGKTLCYTLSESEAIVAINDTVSDDIIIPATITIDGTSYPVTRIRNGAFQSNTLLTGVSIQGTNLTQVDEDAFRGCTSLTTFSGPSVVNVKTGAYYGCTSLTDLTLSPNITFIHQDAFRDCLSLKTLSINYPACHIYDRAFQGCTSLETVNLKVASLGTSAFRNCTGMKTLTVDSHIYDTSVFSRCISLKEVHLKSIPYSYNDTDPTKCKLTSALFPGCTGTLYIDCQLPTEKPTFGSGSPFVDAAFQHIVCSSTFVPSKMLFHLTDLRKVTLIGVITLSSDFAFECENLNNYEIQNSSDYKSYKGCIYTADYQTLQAVPQGMVCVTLHHDCFNLEATTHASNKYLDMTEKAGTILRSVSSTSKDFQYLITSGSAYYTQFSTATYLHHYPRFDANGDRQENKNDIKQVITNISKEAL